MYAIPGDEILISLIQIEQYPLVANSDLVNGI